MKRTHRLFTLTNTEREIDSRGQGRCFSTHSDTDNEK